MKCCNNPSPKEVDNVTMIISGGELLETGSISYYCSNCGKDLEYKEEQIDEFSDQSELAF